MRRSRQKPSILAGTKGRWAPILSTILPELSNTIAKRPKHGPCIVHGGKDGLRCFDDFDETGGMICNTCGAFPDGVKVVAWACVSSEVAARKKIRQILKQPSIRAIHVVSNMQGKSTPKPTFNKVAAKNIEGVISDSIPLSDPEAWPARLYYRNRGLDIGDFDQYGDSLFYHANLRFYDRDTGRSGYSPAIIAKIYHNSDWKTPVCLHRTYITSIGEKLAISASKQLMPAIFKGATNGAAIQLDLPHSNGVLHVAEGIETALAVHQTVGQPAWAAITAGGMERLIVPSELAEIVIWADLDRSGRGLEAAKTLKDRIAKLGISVKIKLPLYEIPEGQNSLDWLDVLNMEES